MKIKVGFLDKGLIKEYLSVLTVISLIFSFFSIIIDVPDNNKLRVCMGFVIVLLIIYIILWIRANFSYKMRLKINNSIIDIKVGDIFEEKELKVIAFNEYFDTQVDNKIISDKTLNGIYINRFVENIEELDNKLNWDVRLQDKIVECNNNRTSGKKRRYQLGTTFQNGNYLLTAFSKFDNDNRAFLYMNDYINFLLNFWNEIDILYAGSSVSIPLLGSGITRFKEYSMISEQELLELLIWSFKISRIKIAYPSRVSIIIHDSIKDKINFYRLKEC